jgi:hypothetical protein
MLEAWPSRGCASLNPGTVPAESTIPFHSNLNQSQQQSQQSFGVLWDNEGMSPGIHSACGYLLPTPQCVLGCNPVGKTKGLWGTKGSWRGRITWQISLYNSTAYPEPQRQPRRGCDGCAGKSLYSCTAISRNNLFSVGLARSGARSVTLDFSSGPLTNFKGIQCGDSPLKVMIMSQKWLPNAQNGPFPKWSHEKWSSS